MMVGSPHKAVITTCVVMESNAVDCKVCFFLASRSLAFQSIENHASRAPQGIHARHMRPHADPPRNSAMPYMQPLAPSPPPS